MNLVEISRPTRAFKGDNMPIAPGLEGAENGLRGWIQEQLRIRFPGISSLTDSGAPPPDSEATVVAAHVLSIFTPTATPALVHALAHRLCRQIQAALRGTPRARWQWSMTILAWMCEACGAPRLLAQHPAPAADLMAEAGFTARAVRQAPFTAWRHGNPGCQEGTLFPGSNANDRDARHISRVGISLPTSAIEGLDGLVARVTRNPPGPRTTSPFCRPAATPAAHLRPGEPCPSDGPALSSSAAAQWSARPGCRPASAPSPAKPYKGPLP